MYLFYSLIGISILSTLNTFNQLVKNYSDYYDNSLTLSSVYNNTNHQRIDKEIFFIISELDKNIIRNSLNNNVCNLVLKKVNEKKNTKVHLSKFKMAPSTNSINYKFINSCAISDGNYRIIFTKNNLKKSLPTFYSCKTSISSYCKFENDSSL